MSSASDLIIKATHDAIADSRLSLYEVGQQWANGSPKSAATMEKRLYRWHGNGFPNAIGDWVRLMDVLGYEVKLIKRKR